MINIFYRRVLNWICNKFGMLIPDRMYLKMLSRIRLDRRLNLKNPEAFNDKLQWLKLYDRNPEYTKLVDKYEVRQYIKNTIGEEYLIPVLGVYDSFDDISFDELPERFVLKCTHDSGGYEICKNKNEIDYENLRNRFNKLLKRNYYYSKREWPYKNIKPRIICEEYMEDKHHSDLMDYKIMCFNGKVKCSFICSNRKLGLNVDFYDINWNLMPFERHYPNSGKTMDAPKNYMKMIELSEKLSENIPFVRVDFYEINGNLYFGEMTFFPGSGFEEFTPEKYDYLLGSWLELPYRNTR